MKNSVRFALFVVVLAAVGFASVPRTARSGPAVHQLQRSVTGRDAVAAGNPGCTRITNRFCVESTRSNCSACL